MGQFPWRYQYAPQWRRRASRGNDNAFCGTRIAARARAAEACNSTCRLAACVATAAGDSYSIISGAHSVWKTMGITSLVCYNVRCRRREPRWTNEY